MIIETKTEEIKFKPCTLSITFESEEELRVWMKLLSYNVSVPAFVCKDRGSQEEKLSETMGKVHEKLVDLMYL